MPVGSEIRSAIATEVNERYMWPMSAGMISSERLFEIQFQSRTFGLRFWKARPATKLLTTLLDFGSARELANGIYAQGTTHVSVRDDEPFFGAAPHQLRERVSQIHSLVYAGYLPVAVSLAVWRVELHVRDAQEREPLEGSVRTHEIGDKLRLRGGEDVLRGVVLGQDAALFEDGDPIAHLYRLVYVVGDEDYRFLDLTLD